MAVTYSARYPRQRLILRLSLVHIANSNIEDTQAHTEQQIQYDKQLADTTARHAESTRSTYLVDVSLKRKLFKVLFKLCLGGGFW